MARRQIFRRNSKGFYRNQVHRRKRTNQSIRSTETVEHQKSAAARTRTSGKRCGHDIQPTWEQIFDTISERRPYLTKRFSVRRTHQWADRHFANKLESPAAVVSSHLEPYVVRNQTCRKGACNHRRDAQLPGPSECTADQQQRERWYRKPSLLRQTGFAWDTSDKIRGSTAESCVSVKSRCELDPEIVGVIIAQCHQFIPSES